MVNTVHTQFPQNSLPRRLQQPQRVTPVRGVMQDNPPPPTDRAAYPQPALVHPRPQSLPPNTHHFRSQKRDSAKVKLVPFQTWIHPLVKAEIQRRAEAEGVSASKVGAIGLEQWVHQSIRDQHEALLYPVIRSVIREELRAFGDRIVHFLMRIAVAIEAVKILIANVLDRMLVGKAAEYTHLIERSDILARQKVLAKIPHIKQLVEKWNAPEEEKGKEETNSAA